MDKRKAILASNIITEINDTNLLLEDFRCLVDSRLDNGFNLNATLLNDIEIVFEQFLEKKEKELEDL